jgi:hypothetical protein
MPRFPAIKKDFRRILHHSSPPDLQYMNQRKGNYEKKLLTIMALLAMAVAGLLIWQSQALPDTLVLKKVTPKDELGEIPVAKAEEATKRLSTVFDWTAPERNGKPVPLNKSILLVVKDDQLFDLFVPNPQLRAPMTNEFLVSNDLPDILYANVGELDPDDDGYSNEEEFLASTNPKDAASKPAATKKLYLKQRITNDYILHLRSSTLPVQVQRMAPDPKKSVFVDPGKEFGFDTGVVRFQALAFEKKVVPDPRSGERDVSELKVMDRATQKEFVLIRGEDLNLAEYEAKFVYVLKGEKEFTVKKGERFQLPGTGDTYLVSEVLETEATIVKIDASGKQGEPLKIEMR